MRYQYLFVLLILLPAKMFAQTTVPDITGLWKGTLYNDSTQQYYQYEVGISEEKGKLSGFSHTWFLLGDQQYYGVKKVTVKRKDGKILIEDEALIANNYPVEPAKGIHQLNVLVLDASDSVMKLTGPFATNRTKKYAPLTGTIYLERKNDYWQSALVPHLQELNLVNELSFVKDDQLLAKNNYAAVAIMPPTGIATKNSIAENNNKTKPVKDIPLPVVKSETLVKNDDPKKEDPKNTANDIVKVTSNKSDTIYSIASANIPPAKNTVPVSPTMQQNKTADPVTIIAQDKKENVIAPTAVTAAKNSIAGNTAAAAEVDKRITLLQQTVSFHSDSLQLSLYDNGEVDGDTVSVLMNGNIIMAKERLSTNAIRKTIYIPQETDSVQLVMYAENLGLIPPNTGLLVVKDGKDLYEIRFSGDLQKNAAIIFRRKK